jgi:hypothetical protein
MPNFALPVKTSRRPSREVSLEIDTSRKSSITRALKVLKLMPLSGVDEDSFDIIYELGVHKSSKIIAKLET